MIRADRFIGRIRENTGRKMMTGSPGDTCLDDVGFVVLDTELTGLKRRTDSIVSIGAVHMTGTRIELGSSFYRLVRPTRALTARSIVIHGITPSETKTAPPFEALLPDLLDFCRSRVVVGYCVHMDMFFVNREIRRVGGSALRMPEVDIFKLYSWCRRKERNACAFDNGSNEDVTLAGLAGQFDIRLSALHNALGDAYITAQLFQRLLSLADSYGIRTLGELLAVARSG